MEWPVMPPCAGRQGPAHGVICDQEDGKMDAGELEFV